MDNFCWHCKNKLSLENKIGFKETCIHCGYDLHVCKNCYHYSPGKPNDCAYPNTEYVSDREKYNFCEEFKYNTNPPKSNQSTTDDIAKRLFKDEKGTKKKSFKDLFDD